ncbi:carbon-nitrogen hydrolase family protein [Actinomadura livida]|uniref:Carbon-nitrogen hydrolase family protein n=1 Tax=Actinomadura livida TaxID=79909 RepID=A0A7W7IFU1_9ACTN|nr:MULTISPECIES: carbon-nitrogen hydrolase family protein [Actinomadura]MBB4776205.1 putative amidohydrolase [Actinomadura catellatispora]GGU14728.1 hydrolase [Actinomadura livida]
MVQVAVAQFAPGVNKDENLAAIGKLAGEAAGRGAKVVVFPEFAMFTAPKLDERFADSAEPLDGPFAGGLKDVARRHGVHVVAGVNERLDEPGRISNTLVAAGPAGDFVAEYRKIHLYDAFGYRESAIVRPGEIGNPETFTVEGVTFGMQTCYDVRFPEVTRRIVDAGADVLALPAAWVPGPLKEDHWRTLARARAIENTIYVAAAGQCAPTGAGNSMLVDPMGVVTAGLGESPGVVAGEVSPERVAAVREKNPALRLRRFTVAKAE